MKRRFVLLALPLLASVLSACSPAGQAKAEAASGSSAAAPANVTLLNVSYDLSRSFYEHLNPEFIRFYEQQHPGSKLVIQQSHGGASKQALAVRLLESRRGYAQPGIRFGYVGRQKTDQCQLAG